MNATPEQTTTEPANPEQPASTAVQEPVKQDSETVVNSAIEKHLGAIELEEIAGEKPKEDAEKPDEPKPSVEDEPPPEGSSDRSKERWGQLTGRVKEAETKIKDYEQRLPQYEQSHKVLQQFESKVKEAGLDGDGLSNMLSMARAFSSDNPSDQQAALAYIDSLRSELALKLGKAIPGADPLAQFPELRAQVDNMQMDEGQAIATAKLMADNKRLQDSARAAQQQTAQQNEIASLPAKIHQALTTKPNTPAHAQKLQYIGQFFSDPAKVTEFEAKYQPSQWLPAIEIMYDMYQPPTATSPSPQPLRSATVAVGAPQRKGALTFDQTLRNAIESHFG